MNRTILSAPPDPNAPRFAGSPDQWQSAMYQWALDVKKRVETDSAANIQPVAPFVVGTYTSTNTLVGTDATSNFLATLVTALQVKGITASNPTRNTT
jgi:hypothetical protein